MKPLRHTVPLGAGETPASFASRLAARHGLSARDFCLDFGTTFQKVVDGDMSALAIIAIKGGVMPEALAANAFVKIGDRRYLLRGEEIVRSSLRRSAVVICPKCLAGDIAETPNPQTDLAPYQRAMWQIAAVKTCQVHAVPLVVAVRDFTPGIQHDWCRHLNKVLPNLSRLILEIEPRRPTGLETYIARRVIDGLTKGGLLDSLPLHAAVAACELFGAVAMLGRTPNLKQLTDEQWHAAGGAGFEIFTGGESAVADFLESLRKSYPYSRRATEGPQAVFGRIYQVLEFGREDPNYDGLRDLVGNFIRTRFSVGAGDVVFGTPVERRTLHSIRTLSTETGLHPKRLRKLLQASGTLPDDAAELADGNCLFDAEKGSLAAREASAATLSVRKAGEYLNAPRVQRDRLYRHGLIIPRIRAGDVGAADKFAPEDLDAFLHRLLDGAKPKKTVAGGRTSIPEAARFACCTSDEIVRLILNGKLLRKWRLTSERGYMSVLVDIEEVRTLVRGPDHGGFTGLQIKDKLSTTAKVAAALIKHGHLKSVTVVNPVNRCPIVVVPAEEVGRFEREFVSLFALARQQRQHHLKVKQQLDVAGIAPALDPKKIGATFYQRDDLKA